MNGLGEAYVFISQAAWGQTFQRTTPSPSEARHLAASYFLVFLI